MAQARARLKCDVGWMAISGRNAAPPETGRRRFASTRDRPHPDTRGSGSRREEACRVHARRDSGPNLTDQVVRECGQIESALSLPLAFRIAALFEMPIEDIFTPD
ncbi:hypothetical protein [Pelagerythrobacter marensis]|uniref:hypothetical protein n=1 Tax=Pelagerythrobacter marensis TaxID=543877 RepID=UPI000A5AC9AD|nr:hypothetical protein [Pelagerythrobacter marensis]